jgi:hypothetical protein
MKIFASLDLDFDIFAFQATTSFRSSFSMKIIEPLHLASHIHLVRHLVSYRLIPDKVNALSGTGVLYQAVAWMVGRGQCLHYRPLFSPP